MACEAGALGSGRFKRIGVAVIALGVVVTGTSASAQRSTQDELPYAGYRWMTVFGASPTDPQPGLALAQQVAPVFTDQTIRQVAHLSAGTSLGLRIHLSNALSGAPITFADVRAGRWAGSVTDPTSAVIPGSDAPLTFNYGQASVTVPPYGEVVSDPIPFTATAGSTSRSASTSRQAIRRRRPSISWATPASTSRPATSPRPRR